MTFKCYACLGTLEKSRLVVPDFEYNVPSVIGTYAECAFCGSFSQSPMPNEAELSAAYPESYHSFSKSSLINRLRQKARIGKLIDATRQIETLNILDYGCGQGNFLIALAERFPNGKFWGFEIAENDRTEILCDGRVVIFHGRLGNHIKSMPKFDIITLNHVIEHLPEPVATLNSLNTLMKDGGIIEGQTPNADSIERGVFGNRWSGFHSPRHTVVFTKKGISEVMRHSGFVNCKVKNAFNPASWAVSLGSMFQNANNPKGIVRTGVYWLFLVLAATPLAFVESRFKRGGIIDFKATK